MVSQILVLRWQRDPPKFCSASSFDICYVVFFTS